MKKIHIAQILVVIVLLLAGAGGFYLMHLFRKPPRQKAPLETVVEVEGIRLTPRDIQTTLSGLGTAEAHRRTHISTEVSGRVVEVHLNLENGEVVYKGDLLVKIDPRNYKAAVDEAKARIDSLEARIELLRKKEENARRRIDVIQRDRDLARKEYERFQELVRMEGVESQSRLEQVEQAYTKRQDQLIAIENTLLLFPIEIRQTMADLESAKAQLELAEYNLERSSISAPFTGRISEKLVEVGMQVMQSNRLLTLIDDSQLEIPVPLIGREVMFWMQLNPSANMNHWFDNLPELKANVHWVENPDQTWAGQLERIQDYDRDSRTVTLIISVASRALSSSEDQALPLVEGMFCKVSIPGKIIENAFMLPREAVSHDNQVLLVEDGKIKSKSVEVIRNDGDFSIIREVLNEGDHLITSRPGISIDGTRVNFKLIDQDSGSHEHKDAEVAEAGDGLQSAEESGAGP